MRRDTHGAGSCHMLPLPDCGGSATEESSRAPTARLQAQPSSRVWPSSSGSFAAAEIHTLEGPALRLKDLATGRQSQVSLQVLLNELLVRAWVSDNGKAVLVLSSIHDQQHLHLLLRQEGHPDSSLPQQVRPPLPKGVLRPQRASGNVLKTVTLLAKHCNSVYQPYP